MDYKTCQKLIDASVERHRSYIEALVHAYTLSGGERLDLRLPYVKIESDEIAKKKPIMTITDQIRAAIVNSAESFTISDIADIIDNDEVNRIQISMTLKRLSDKGEIKRTKKGKGSNPNRYKKIT